MAENDNTESQAPEEIVDKADKRTKFGTRYLTDPKSVFQHNAWDNVSWDEEQETAARDIAITHAQKAISQEERDKYDREAATHWDKFYSVHSNHFFKDRHWLFTEFPELHGGAYVNGSPDMPTRKDGTTKDDGKTDSMMGRVNETDSDVGATLDDKPFRLLEVGCGVGNTVFPVLKSNRNPNLMVYCCDFSSTAIDIVKSHPDYERERCQAFVHDITDGSEEVPIAAGSLDVIVMIFVLSAVCPEKMQEAVIRLSSYLRPGGTFLFRDYGRYDMVQLRFKEGRCLSENFYVRGDGTRVYFFSQDELRTIFEQAGLKEQEIQVDRRLQVNRGRNLKMYRVWIQCKFTKP